MTEASPLQLDPAALAELRALDPDGRQGLIRRLGEAWERTLERQLPELDAALAAGPDLARVARVAHTLKSSCANLAALQLAAQWQTIEQQIKEGRREGIEDRVAQVRAELGSLRDALRAIE